MDQSTDLNNDIDRLFETFPSEDELMDEIMHISTTVWSSEIGKKDIERWLRNFKGEVFDIKYERLIALWLLSHFTYYNTDEVRHLCKVVYYDLLHLVVLKDLSSGMPIRESISQFFQKSSIISPEKTSGSGGFIAYYFRQENNLAMDLFNYYYKNIGTDIENIILIDDVILTEGKNGQMHGFLENIVNHHKGKNIFLLTLIASNEAYECLRKSFPLVDIVTAIKLDNRDRAFAQESDIFATCKELMALGKKFATYYGNKINIGGASPLGFSDGQYTFGFFYNTPDNTLPIFWGQINGWMPILKRYHKKYRGEESLNDKTFI